MAPSLTIDPLNGFMRIAGCNLVIAKGLTKARAWAGLEHLHRSSVDHGNGYEWLAFDGVRFGGQPAGFSLGLHLGAVEQVTIGVSLPEAGREGGWPTQRAIEQEVGFTRKELSRQLSRPFDSGQEHFAWGVAWSLFDQKGFLASAGIRYAP